MINKIKEGDVYYGDVIHQPFAYKQYGKLMNPTGNVFVWRAPMHVDVDNMIDLEDVIQEDNIRSKDAINIIWEVYNMDPVGSVAFQRLFNTLISGAIKAWRGDDSIVFMQGDDIMSKASIYDTTNEKLSVSITYCDNGTTIGHTGLNIKAGKKAPSFAGNIGVMDDDDIENLGCEISRIFYELLHDLNVSSRKICIK
tara:strand:- start:17868 stop:18458 length:591 start_codon:yes stop_codon:yes gene_type:complete